MSRILSGTRYLVVIPVIGLAVAAAALGVFLGLRAWSVKLSKESSAQDEAIENPEGE